MIELTAILGIALFFFCLAITLLRALLKAQLALLDWAVLAMGGVYGLGWVIVALVTSKGKNAHWENWLMPFEYMYPFHTFCVLILLASVSFGWLLFGSVHVHCKKTVTKPGKFYDNRLRMAFWMLLAIAFLTQWLYSDSYGGFIGALRYSRAIRSGIFVVENQWSFLQPFGSLALFSSLGFFGLWSSKHRTFDTALGFFLSFAFSLYVLYSRMGRIAFLSFMATFVLAIVLSLRRHPSFTLMCGGAVMLAIGIGTYYVSQWLNLKPANSILAFLARELSFPFASFFAQLDLGEHLLRAFKDFFISPIYLLPSSWWSQWAEDVGQINTAVIMGAPKGEQGVTAAIPVDLLTLGLMQASVLGIAVAGTVFGGLLRLIQQVLDQIRNVGVRNIFEAWVTIKIAVLGVFYAHPSLFMAGNFALIVTVVVIIIFIKFPKLRFASHRVRDHQQINITSRDY